jgi:hypothetical protein
LVTDEDAFTLTTTSKVVLSWKMLVECISNCGKNLDLKIFKLVSFLNRNCKSYLNTKYTLTTMMKPSQGPESQYYYSQKKKKKKKENE